MVHFKPIILFVSFLLENIFTDNLFNLHPVYESGEPTNYRRPVISENGEIYIISGENELENSIRYRYIIKYDINSGDFVEQIKYKSNYGF